jgi:hypothetical protein
MSNGEANRKRRVVIRGLATWLALMDAEIICGILQAIILVSLVDEFHSNQIGVLSGSAIIIAIAFLTIRWIGAELTRELLLVGLVWLLLTVAFEFLFGRFVIELTWERLAADYYVLNGGLMPLGLLVLFFSPLIAWELRGKR